MKGYCWGAASVILVSAAQLLMKWGMIQLPLLFPNLFSISALLQYLLPICAVLAGVCGYALSMICWFFALKYLPLNKAYPLLSISYALVYVLAICVPFFNETATLLKTLGALFILLGVWIINSKSTDYKKHE